jgi:hypothetical protein
MQPGRMPGWGFECELVESELVDLLSREIEDGNVGALFCSFEDNF